ncbi:MAG TPA: protein kinase [Vicinamibacteria bacterium]|nr:protein kinase [Vicinamibacteria bacterium]
MSSLPSRIGRYEIQALLGQGGMGAVYKAHDPELDRTVAVKTVHALLLSGEEREEFLERFRREARAAGRLSHPNIVSVYDFGTDGETAFFVMEFVSGVSLETILKENPLLPVGQAQDIVEQVAAGLAEAHRHGIVHRDVKPANVFVDERGRVKVGDFGIARMEGSELTQKGVGLGTPGYSAPELLRGGPATVHSDVFALGVLAYRVFTGRRPFQGTLPEALALDILEHRPAAPHALRPEVPPHVSDAILRALAKTPEERTPNAEAFARELRGDPEATPALGSPGAGPALAVPAAAAAATAPTGTIATVRVPDPPPRRWPWMAVGVAAAVLLSLAAALLAWRASRAAPGPGEATSVATPSPVVSARARAAEPGPRATPRDAPSPSPDLRREAERTLQDLLRAGLAKAQEEARKAESKRDDDEDGHPGRGRGKAKGRGKGKKNR